MLVKLGWLRHDFSPVGTKGRTFATAESPAGVTEK